MYHRQPLTVLVSLLALGFLMLVAYRGYSVILFAPVAALGAVLLTMPGAVLPAYSALFMENMATFVRNYFPGLHARRAVRQDDRDLRLRQGAGGGHHPRRRPPSRDARDRHHLRADGLRRRLGVRGRLRGLSVCGGTVPRSEHSQASDPGDDVAGDLHLRDGRVAGQSPDSEHHPDDVLRHDHDGGADPRADRRRVHLRRRHGVSRMAAASGVARGRNLRHRPSQRAGTRGSARAGVAVRGVHSRSPSSPPRTSRSRR